MRLICPTEGRRQAEDIISMRVVIRMKVHGVLEGRMERDCISGRIIAGIMGSGRMIRCMGKVRLFMRMELQWKGNLEMIRRFEW